MVTAIGMVKDEADVIERTVLRMLAECDEVTVADNGSTDGTRDILADLERQHRLALDVVDDPEVGYYQSRKMTAMAAREDGEWIVPFDADEQWYSPHGRIADILTGLPADVATVPADLYDHVPTALDPEGHPFDVMGWRRRDPAPLPKVACRRVLPVRIEQGNHAATYAADVRLSLLVVRHYPYRSPNQMVRKAINGAAAYAATDLPEHQGQHWRDYGRLVDTHGPEALHGVFREYFWSADPHGDGLLFDPCPSTS